MKKIFIFLGLVTLLTWCLVNEKENDFFEEKQECIKLTDSLIEKTQKIWEEYGNGLYKFTFESVFYSPKYNNCLWIRVQSWESNWNYNTFKRLYEIWNDSWSSDPIDLCTDFERKWSERKNDCGEMYERIEKLK